MFIPSFKLKGVLNHAHSLPKLHMQQFCITV